MRWRRALRTPLILLGINLGSAVLAGGVVYGYADQQAARHDGLTATLQQLSQQRATAVEDLAYIEANRSAFDELLEGGLLADQDRLAAARLLEELARRHGLNGIRYSFDPQRAAPLGPGRLAEMTLLTTTIAIEMTAVLDRDVLAFARSAAAQLPGEVRVTGLRLERHEETGPNLLARLRDGVRVHLVAGRLQLDWRTLRWQGAAVAAAPRSS